MTASHRHSGGEVSDTRCTIEGCEKPARTRGLCRMHYERLRRAGTTDPRPRVTACTVDGCSDPVRNRGLCVHHYVQDQAARRPERWCEVADCDKKLQHNLCPPHAERWRKYGDPAEVRLILGNPEQRFWARVDKDSSLPCWLWTGWCNENGYGQFNLNGGERIAAHRYSYELHKGPIPDGLTIDHVYAWGCRHRGCVNPDHLEAVTQAENNRRAREVRSCAVGS